MMWRTVVLFVLFCLLPQVVCAETVYVKSSCSNNITTYNPGADTCTGGSSRVFTTISNAFSYIGLGAGAGANDVVDIRGGTYAETLINNWPGGTSWAAPFTVQAHAGETATLVPPGGSITCGQIGATTGNGNAIYVDVNGLNCNGNANGGAHEVTGNLWKLGGNLSGFGHHIRYRNAELQGAILGILSGGPGIEIIGNTFHNLVDPADNQASGIYFSGQDGLIERNHFYDIAPGGYCATIWNVGGGVARNIYRYNLCEGAALNISGRDNVIHNNITHNAPYGAMVVGYPCSGCGGVPSVNNQVYNNTVVGAGTYCAQVMGSGSKVQNNVCSNITNATKFPIDPSATGYTITHNACENGSCGTNAVINATLGLVNPAGGDFSLLSTSPLRNAGTQIAGYPFNANEPDIGAHEGLRVISATVEAATPNTLNVNWENNRFPPVASCTAANFAVRVAGGNRSITSCTIVGSNRTDVVFGGAAVTAGLSVAFDYTPGTLRDSADIGRGTGAAGTGKNQKAFTCNNCATVQNNTGAGAATPVLSSASVENATPTVVKMCAATADPPMLPATTCTGVTITNKTISSCARNAADNKCMDLTVSVGFAAGAVETIAYSQTGNITSSGAGFPELAAFSGQPITNNVTPAAPSGLVGHWKFDETSGTVADDATANNNDGTLNSFPASPWTTAGIFNGGLVFDGVNDRVTMGTPSVLNITGTTLTVSVWAKGSGVGNESFRYLISKTNTTNTGYALYTGASGSIRFYIGTGVLQLTADTVPNPWDGAWHHFAGVFTGSLLNLYVDGVLAVSTSASGSIADSSTRVFTVGTFEGGTLPFPGTIDDVRVFNTALSAAEINGLFATGPVALSATVENATPTIVTMCTTTNDPPLLPQNNCTLAGFTVAGHTITDCDRSGASDPTYKCMDLVVSPAFSSAETARTLAYDPSLGNVTDSKAGNPELALFAALPITNNVVPGGTANLDQEAFRFECWGGTEAIADCAFPTNTNITTYPGGCFKLRVRLDNEGTADQASVGFSLYAQKNGSGGYTQIPNTCGATDLCFSEAAPELLNVATTEKLTDACSFIAGGVLLRNDEVPTTALPVGVCTELLGSFCVGTGVSNGDYWEFELRKVGGMQIETYTVRPKVTIGVGLGSLAGGSVSGGTRQ